jgi:hypothetical protein
VRGRVHSGSWKYRHRVEDGTVLHVATWFPDEGVVQFPDGQRVRGRSLRRPEPKTLTPEFGVYLLTSPPKVDWPMRWVRWPDFRLPSNKADVIDAVRDALGQASERRVEIACTGGRGRTGTALARMAVMCGIPRQQAVAWVRQHYHPGAVETPWQSRWV